jgi:CheY-like chemotaxis protein
MSQLKALVFDDDEMIRHLLVDILSIRNVQVSSYADPNDFLSEHNVLDCLAEEPCFDLILTDNKMPTMTGLAFLEHIKDHGCCVPKRQQAIISGTWSEGELVKAEALGCRIFEKPCPPDLILDWIDDLMLLQE